MQNKTLAYWIVGIVGAVLIIILIVQLHSQNNPASGNSSPASDNAALSYNGQEATTTPPAANTSGTSGIGYPSNSAYTAVLAIYQKNGYRVQFSQCHGIPGKLTVTQGQKYMLDNRDDQKHTVKVGPYTYSLPAYGWQVITAENLGLNNVTCDGGGAAQINIEK